MIWLLFLALAALVLAPLAFALLRPARLTGRREADLALYRAQLAELEREREAGRLEESAHRAAVVEVQRRLLATPETVPASRATRGSPGATPRTTPRTTPGALSGGAALLAASLFLVPAAGFGIYLWGGHPDIPAAPFRERAAEAAREEALLAQLRSRIEQLPPGSEAARQGWILLGNAQRGRGRLTAAAEAWEHALGTRFDPDLAAELAGLRIELSQFDRAAALLDKALAVEPNSPQLRFLRGMADAQAGRPEAARAAWTTLMAALPPDSPWRRLLRQRLDALP
ncbi:c-type cytochrome biogenesis protein CcmI [Roseomonas sp. M0104]|uniref:C-type cytochrome biogenesis protein CcmI n=1 Tax=Teichococcus coralli TaxID=2545983 RepID=A0A845BB81_9PROT|nr:c-type cytochrome biogenesis protein CcmI [Pseudoroseomonas coralli]MXP64853.1 c-type cytochrome biogenesis protein CcmI [Pseudoroseomonas coralli]